MYTSNGVSKLVHMIHIVCAKGFPATSLQCGDMRKLRRVDTFPHIASQRSDAVQNPLA